MELIKTKMKKKGIFFVTIAVLILLLFLSAYTFYGIILERKTIQNRVTTMNNLLFSIEQDLERNVYISGYRIIFLLEKQIGETGSYISSLNSSAEELFFNGTLYQNPAEIMLGATFNDILTATNDNAKKTNVEITISNPKFYLTQETPWKVSAILLADLSMKDNSNTASWSKTLLTKSYIDIQNFNDPLYAISTNGRVSNKINHTTFIPFIQGGNIQNLSTHAINSFYINSTRAPGFLDRLQGINTPNQNGIESFVNLQKLANQGITVYDKSVVDYIYFSSQDPSPLCIVSGMPSWFKVDSTSAGAYGISC